MNNIEALNAISKSKRKDLPFENNFNINELSLMPELFDWVFLEWFLRKIYPKNMVKDSKEYQWIRA
jgi:hypothetical protein